MNKSIVKLIYEAVRPSFRNTAVSEFRVMYMLTVSSSSTHGDNLRESNERTKKKPLHFC